MTNRIYGVLYVGVTSDIARRVHEHRTGFGGKFTHKYNLSKLVYMERFDDAMHAIQREKTIKRWLRQWKLNAIDRYNPGWNDLFDTLNH